MISPLSNPTYLVAPLIATLATIVMALLVWRRSRRDFSSRLFCVLLLSMTLYSLMTFMMRSSPDVHQAVLWDRVIPLAGFAIFVFYYHFSLTYTGNKQQRGFLLVSYLILVIATGLIPTPLLVDRMVVADYGYAPIAGPLAYPLTVGIVLMGAATYNMLRQYKASRSYEERNRLLYLSISPLFPMVGGLLDGFSGLPPLAIWANLIFCIICSIAILRYHLLDIRIIVRKSLVYLLISAVVAIPYVGLLYILQHFIGPTMKQWWTHILIILLLAVILRPLYSWAQDWVDRLFYRERYDFLRKLEDFSQETHEISNPDQLISSLVKLISRALQSSSVYLLLPSRSEDFITVCSAGENTFQLTIESDSPLLRWLRSNGDILRHQGLDTIPQLQALTAKVRNELEKIRAKLFVPLKTKEEGLVGILILSEKLSEQPYSKDDEGLVVTVASRVSVELENARLYALERSTRRKLERQDEMKTEFLHSVAHELKTPLTAIISSSELLGELSSITSSQRQRLIHNINHGAWLMDKKLTDLLDFAKVEVGNLELKLESLGIDVIIEEVASQLLPLFESKEQSLKLEIADPLSPVKADRDKLEQILLNLLSNANKFSPAGGNITLRAREVDDRVVVEVKDSAPAITEGEKDRLFTPYYRGGGTDEKQRVPGLGLGLTISRKLVELHQGRIWVEGEPGKGNIFAFSLPK